MVAVVFRRDVTVFLRFFVFFVFVSVLLCLVRIRRRLPHDSHDRQHMTRSYLNADVIFGQFFVIGSLFSRNALSTLLHTLFLSHPLVSSLTYHTHTRTHVFLHLRIVISGLSSLIRAIVKLYGAGFF